MEKKQSKIAFSEILLWIVLALSIVHLVFLMLGLFGVLTPSYLERPYFSYIVAFVLVALCLMMYICLMIIEKRGRMIMPEWFKVVFYVGFYIFTNVYYYFGLFGSVAGLIIFYMFLAFVINIIALAVFFNTQKSENNVLKGGVTFTTVTVFCYSVAAGALLETVISAFKMVLFSQTMFATLSMFIIDMCVIVLVSIVMAIAFGLSLSKTKALINKCLIKMYNEKQR